MTGQEEQLRQLNQALELGLLAEAVRLAKLGAVSADVPRRIEMVLVTDGYRRARDELAADLDRNYCLASAYSSMEEFWADADQQVDGEVARTYWDSYEHGLRRTLERTMATSYGCDTAVLVNSGMSAIDVALRAVGVRPGGTALVHHRHYFETDDYLEHVLAPTGVRVARVDLTDPVAVASALTGRPDVVLVEPVLNGPTCDVPVLDPLLAHGCPVVVDNSVLSHALPGALLAGHRSSVLVVESGSKYLCRQASSGVVYGWGELGEFARDTARRTGQQLQGRALHRLRVGEVLACATRLGVHARNAATFAAELARWAPKLEVTRAGDSLTGRSDLLAEHLKDGGGCLVFVSRPNIGQDTDQDAETWHRTTVATWGGAQRRVRAGFGWATTFGRAYGRDALNTSAGRAYIRISVGLESELEIRALARSLADAAHRTSAGPATSPVHAMSASCTGSQP